MAKAIKEKPYRIRAVSENGAMAASIIQSAGQVPSLLLYYEKASNTVLPSLRDFE